MRQLVLVVVLVGAAFLGGAFVNGPGLRWAQTQLLGSLGVGQEGEIASVDLKGGASPDGPAPGENPAATKAPEESARGPVAPVPTVVADTGATTPSRPEGRGREREGGRRPAPAAASPPTGPSAGTPPRRPARAPRDPDVALAAASSSSTPPMPGPGTPAAADRDGRPALMDSLASLMPTPAPAPPDALAPPVPAPARPRPEPVPGKPGADDWATLARKMQALGVSRFQIEGQPGGRIVFSCLIPLAGRQAVAQRFEAEGDDALQAARAALRRVALWRAAQSSQPPH